MSEPFNPYHAWLGLDTSVVQPDYYQLLGVDDAESDSGVIGTAADRALTKVRSFRPGAYARAWAQLLDELATAKRCLTNPEERAKYDERRRVGLHHSPPVETPTPTQASPTPPNPMAPFIVATPTAAGPVPGPTAGSWPPTLAQPTPFTVPSAHPDPMAPLTLATPSPQPLWAFPAPTGGVPTAYSAPGPTAPGPTAPLAAPVAIPPSPVSPGATAAAPMALPLATPYGYGTAQSSSPIPSGMIVPSSPEPPPMVTSAGGISFPNAPPAPTTSPLPQGQLLMPDEAFGASHDAPSLRSTTAVNKAVERQRSRLQLPIIVAVGSGLALIAIGIVVVMLRNERRHFEDSAPAVAQKDPRKASRVVTKDVRTSSSNSSPTRTEPKPRKTSPSVAIERDPSDNPGMTPEAKRDPPEKPDSPTNPPREPKPDSPPAPKPDPKPEAKPEPKTEPKPEPKPDPRPEPKPAPATTSAEVQALAKALTKARTALGEQNYDVADQELAKAESLAKLPPHVDKVERLKQLTHYCKEFRRALVEAVKDLKGGDSITVGSTTVGVVEPIPAQEKIILRVAGMNRTYRLQDLPLGLAAAIADRWLNKESPSTLVVKGAFVIAHKNATEENRAKAKSWWDEARGSAPEVVMLLMPVIEDRYDNLEKDLAGAATPQ